MEHPPQSARPTQVLEWNGGRQTRLLDELAGEEPLEIRVGGAPLSVTMRTPGDDFELAAGFLLTEGVIAGREQILRIAYGCGSGNRRSGNVVDVTLAPGVEVDARHFDRRFFATSSCGICGKASIDRIRVREIEPPSGACDIDPQVLIRLPDALRSRQRIFGRTGGLHAAALFDAAGAVVDIREDVGRHNAVDKIVGAALLEGKVPLSDRILLVSGRGGFEIVQKALVAGVPVLAAVSAPSSLAVQLAREFGLTLVGFLRGARFLVYAGERRLVDGGGAGAYRALTPIAAQ
jgi:FdhD protein